MKAARSSLLSLSVLALVLGCSSSPPSFAPACPAAPTEALGWVTPARPALACTGGALSLAVLGEGPGVAADGQTVLQVAVRVGLDFPLVGADVTLLASGGSFIAPGGGADTGTFTTVADANGVALVPLRVGTTPGSLLITARQSEGGKTVAETVLPVPLQPAPLQSVFVTFADATLRSGTPATVRVRGFLDAEGTRPAPGPQRVQLCLQDPSNEVVTAQVSSSQVLLNASGEESVLVTPLLRGPSRATLVLRACAAAAGCDAPAPLCAEEAKSVEPAVPGLARMALWLDTVPLRPGQTRTLSVAGFSDEYVTPAPANIPVQVCVGAPGGLDKTTTVLGDKGVTSVKLSASGMAENKELYVVACPYEVSCEAAATTRQLPDTRCTGLVVPMDVPQAAVQRLAVGLTGSRLLVGKPLQVLVWGYADEAGTRMAAPGSAVRLCASGPIGLSTTLVELNAEGKSTTATVTGLGPGAAVVTACPFSALADSAQACASEPPCASVPVQVEENFPVQALSQVLTPQLQEGVKSTLTVTGFADRYRLEKASPGQLVRICADARLQVSPQVLALDANSQAIANVQPAEGTAALGERLGLTVCPYRVPCEQQEAAECDGVQLEVLPPVSAGDGGVPP